jgi:hypothetical protein
MAATFGELTVIKFTDGSATFSLKKNGQTYFYWHATSAQVTTLNVEIDAAGIAGAPTDDGQVKPLPGDPNVIDDMLP